MSKSYDTTFQRTTTSLEPMCAFITNTCQRAYSLHDEAWLSELLLAATEVATNILRHTNTNVHSYHVAINTDASEVALSFTYEGDRFTPPKDIQSPDPEALLEHGYGLYLIREMTSRVVYEYDGTQHIRLYKDISQQHM